MFHRCYDPRPQRLKSPHLVNLILEKPRYQKSQMSTEEIVKASSSICDANQHRFLLTVHHMDHQQDGALVSEVTFSAPWQQVNLTRCYGDYAQSFDNSKLMRTVLSCSFWESRCCRFLKRSSATQRIIAHLSDICSGFCLNLPKQAARTCSSQCERLPSSQ